VFYFSLESKVLFFCLDTPAGRGKLQNEKIKAEKFYLKMLSASLWKLNSSRLRRNSDSNFHLTLRSGIFLTVKFLGRGMTSPLAQLIRGEGELFEKENMGDSENRPTG